MCEVVAYMRGGETGETAQELMKDVARVEAAAVDGEITLWDVMGRAATYAARIRSIDLLGHKLYLEPLPGKGGSPTRGIE